MKRILACVAVLLGTTAVFVVGQSKKRDVTNGAGSTYTNPIMSGDWSDPGLIRVGSDYYSVRSTFGWQPGLPVAHSRDPVPTGGGILGQVAQDFAVTAVRAEVAL
jgi:hypothetical protein